MIRNRSDGESRINLGDEVDVGAELNQQISDSATAVASCDVQRRKTTLHQPHTERMTRSLQCSTVHLILLNQHPDCQYTSYTATRCPILLEKKYLF